MGNLGSIWTLLLAGGAGSVLFMSLKSFPAKIWNLFRTRYTMGIHGIGLRNIGMIEKFFTEGNNNTRAFNNQILVKADDTFNTVNSRQHTMLGYGIFIKSYKKFTYSIINRSKSQTNEGSIIDELNITTFGIRKYRDLLKSEFEEYLLNLFNDGERDIYICNNPSAEHKQFHKICHRKTFENVFSSNTKNIKNKIDNWIKNKEIYNKNAIIFKLGILLYGEPGTGKTSLVRAIASYTKRDIFSINLKSYTTTSSLTYALDSLSCGTIVVFEDIDCILDNRENIDDKEKSKNQELLNIALQFIDGLNSPDDTIIIATTNYIERLDDALIRPGRFDVKMEIGNIDRNLAEEMCKAFERDLSELDYPEDQNIFNPAELQGKILTKIGDEL